MAFFSVKKGWAALVLILTLSGCVQTSVATPTAPALPLLTKLVIQATEPPVPTETVGPVKVEASPTDLTPLPAEQNPPVDKPKPASQLMDVPFQGPLSVIITSPLDEAVVSTNQLIINGEADPETVISINDQIVLVRDDRKFSVPLVLEEGPNIIEITASDLDGNQGSAYLSVTYDPQP